MKNIPAIIFHIIFLLLLLPISIYAQNSATESQLIKDDEAMKKIEDLKERIATKVAQLKTTQKKAIYGKVKSVSISSVIIETDNKDIKIDLTDSIRLVQYINGKRTILSLENLSVGDYVTIFGSYNTTLDLLSAAFILIQDLPPIRNSGKVSNISKDNYTITITTTEQREIIIDYEKTTKTVLWNKEDKKFTKGGFTTFSINDIIHVTGISDPNNKDRIKADRILDITNSSIPTLTPPVSSVTPVPESPTLKQVDE